MTLYNTVFYMLHFYAAMCHVSISEIRHCVSEGLCPFKTKYQKTNVGPEEFWNAEDGVVTHPHG